MKKITLFGIFALLLVSLSACSTPASKPVEQVDKSDNSLAEPTQFLAEYLEADWLRPLPEQKWNEIEKSGDSYTYDFQGESLDDSEINKSVSYKQTDNGDYQGTLKVSFSKTSDSYVLNIPKSFASHVDMLNFSAEPSSIINPDPIVEFSNIEGEIDIESSEIKNREEIDSDLEKQIIDTEALRCESLGGEKSVHCMLSLVSKYRDSEYIKDELKHMNMAELIGASAQAILQSDMNLCRHVTGRSEKELCYEFSYQILVKDCDTLEGSSYRECVRTHSSNFPSLKEQRLFCAYITDEEMRKECQGLAPLESCDEIKNDEDRFVCKLNILRTGNDLSACHKLNDDVLRESCMAIIGADREDASVCNKIKDDYLKGQCLTKVAMVTHDKTLCSGIKDEDSQDLCNGFFIMKLETTKEMCDSTNELFLKELCEMSLAIQEKDINKCMDPNIVGPDNQATCLAGIGMKHDDESVCAMIDTSIGEFEEDRKLREMTRDLCYMKVAISKKNEAICNKINDAEQREVCKEELQEKEEKPTISCADVTPAICPMKSSGSGGSKHLSVDGHDVQCTYYTSKEAGYPLYNEMFKLGKIRDGSYKQYYKSGAIKVLSEHKDGRNEGFRIECSEGGELQQCWFYTPPGEKNIDCMP